MQGLWKIFGVVCLAVFFCLPGLNLLAGEGATPLKLKVLPAAVVHGQRVQLREIAQPLPGSAQQAWLQAGDKYLWTAPEKGRSQTLSRAAVRELLQFYLGQEVEALIWIPTSVTIYTQGVLLPKAQVVQEVQAWLQQQSRGLDGEVEFRKLVLPDVIYLPQKGLHLAFSLQGKFRPGANTFWLQIESPDNKVVRRISGSVFVDCWQTVPCAARPLNKGEALLPGLVTFKRKNLAYLRERVWDGQGGPWRIKTSVGTGQPVFMRNLEAMPAVCKGRRMDLIYLGRNVRLRVPVLSLQEGEVGDVIRVRNLQSARKVFAKVVDSQTVVIEAIK